MTSTAKDAALHLLRSVKHGRIDTLDDRRVRIAAPKGSSVVAAMHRTGLISDALRAVGWETTLSATYVEATQPAPAPTEDETFALLLDLEHDAQGARASVELAPANLPLYLKDARFKAWKKAQADLYAAIDSLSLEQLERFGAYRKARRAEALAEAGR